MELRLSDLVVSQRFDFSIATTPPAPWQCRSALAVLAAGLIGFTVLAPLAPLQLARIDGFVTAVLSIVFAVKGATAALLFGQFCKIRSRALLVLAGGYLFSALIAIPHALAFPGAFAPAGLVGAGTQASAWLYFISCTGFFLAVMGYTGLKDEDPAHDVAQDHVAAAVCSTVLVVIGMVGALTFAVVQGASFLPRLLANEIGLAAPAHLIAGITGLVGVLAFAMLWIRRRSVLDLWVMVAVGALTLELALVSFVLPGRFCLADYLGRLLSVVMSAVVLGMLVAETIRSHAAPSRGRGVLEREREGKRMTVEAALASLIHEVRQPLAAIVAKGSAARRLLDQTPSDVARARALLDDVIGASFRANEPLATVSALLGAQDRERRPLDPNALTLDALALARGALRRAGIAARLQLTPDLPPIAGDAHQLQEAVLCLIENAIDAMSVENAKGRLLRIATGRRGTDRIFVAVEDSGSGIDPDRISSIYQPFITSRTRRLGLGLTACRTIVERHDGTLGCSPAADALTRFEITLPVAP